MNNNNNLNTVNEILFSTLRELESGRFENDKVKGVVTVSNAIIKNAKLQLDAHRFFEDCVGPKPKLFIGETTSAMLQLETAQEEHKENHNAEQGSFAHKLQVAKDRGFKNVSEAISTLGKYEFLNACKL